MKKQTKEKIKTYPKTLKYFFFLAGIIATLAYRVLIVLNYYSPYWVKVAWYIGTIGFTIYFGYRFDVQRRESNLVNDYDLLGAIRKSGIDKKHKRILNHVVGIVSKSKAKWNSLFIFLLSFAVLVLGILIDVGLVKFG